MAKNSKTNNISITILTETTVNELSNLINMCVTSKSANVDGQKTMLMIVSGKCSDIYSQKYRFKLHSQVELLISTSLCPHQTRFIK